MLSIRLDPTTLFESESRSADLARRSVRGGLSTLSGQLIRASLQVAATAILARLLTPSDYGLIAMATVIVVLAQVIKDGGLSMATIQRDSIDHNQVSNLFWLNMIGSTLIAGAVVATAPLVAKFYDNPELTWITASLAVAFLFSGVAVQHEALLRRHMRFTAIAIAQVFSQLVNVVVAITAALLGARYWSLVLGTTAASLASTVIIFWLCPWKPGRFRRGSGTKSMLRFGSHVMAFNFMYYFAENSDYILIGRFIGAQPLGLYTRAYTLFSLPLSQVRSPMVAVAVPALGALRDQPARFASYYRKLVEGLALLTVPIGVYCILEAPFVIGVLLGDEWTDAIPVFRWLALAGVTQAVVATRGLILVSFGRSREYVLLGAANMTMRIAAVVAGLPYGINGVAAGLAIGMLLFTAPSVWFFTRNTPVSPADFYRSLARPLAFGLAAGLTALLVRWLLPDMLVAHVAVLICYLGVYIGLCFMNKTVRANIAQLKGLIASESVPPGGGENDA